MYDNLQTIEEVVDFLINKVDKEGRDFILNNSPSLIHHTAGRGLRNELKLWDRESPIVKDAIKKYKAVYFAAIGGTGALISRSIKKSEVIAYEELGAEAIRRLEVEDLPATVVNDIYGADLYQEGKTKYRIE